MEVSVEPTHKATSRCMPGVVRPMALGFKTDEVRRVLSVDETGRL